MPGSSIHLLVQFREILFRGPLSMAGAMLWGCLLYLICLPLFFRKKRLTQNFCIALLFLYAAALLQSCRCLVAPDSFQPANLTAADAVAAVEWNPFLFSSFGVSNLWATLLRDFLILMPIGFLVPLAASRARLWKMLILSPLCGIGLEVLQLLANILSQTSERSVSTGAAILSTAGCLTGYLLFSALRKLPLPKQKARHYAHPGQAS